MPVSKFQSQTKERLMMLLQGYTIEDNYRPDWLINPLTGRRLEIDIWLPDVKIGIEVQGAQHTRFIPSFHKDESDFEKQKARDDFKRAICQQRGIHLYEVYTLNDIDTFIESARGHCAEMAHELHIKQTALKSLSYHAAQVWREMHKKRGKNPQMIKDLCAKMIHICEKYHWRLEDIKPDLSIRKVDMAFGAKKMVKIEQYGNERGNRHERAALMSINDGVVKARWQPPWGDYVNFEFDLETGYQIPKEEKGWLLKLGSLPETIYETPSRG